MRILHVARQFYPSRGGIETVVLGLARALRAAGHACGIVTLQRIFNTGERAAPRDTVDGFPVIRLAHVGPRRYAVAPAVVRWLVGYDVVHVHSMDFFLDYLSALRGWHRKPLVVTTHGGIFHTARNLRFKRFWFQTVTRLSLRGVEAVISISRQDDVLFAPIVPARKRHVLYQGVELDAFGAVVRRPQPGLLVGVGRLAENKRVDRVITALAEVSADQPGAQLVWLGEDEAGRSAHLLALAERLGIASRIRLLGPVSQSELLNWLAQAHYFVSAADYESFGVSTLEAMAAGVVPLVTPVGIHPEIVVPGATGFLWDFSQPAGAAQRLRQALALPPAELVRLGAAAGEAARRFTWDQVAPRYLAVYQEARQS